MLNLIASPPNTTADLDNLVRNITGQAEVVRKLLAVERHLTGVVPRHLKYEYLRPFLHYIHAKPCKDDISAEKRRNVLVGLNNNSKALCGITFTVKKIQSLTDDVLEALRTGLPGFIERRGLSELLDTRLGDFVRRTTEEFSTSTIRFIGTVQSRPAFTTALLTWKEHKSSKRQKRIGSGPIDVGRLVCSKSNQPREQASAFQESRIGGMHLAFTASGEIAACAENHAEALDSAYGISAAGRTHQQKATSGQSPGQFCSLQQPSFDDLGNRDSDLASTTAINDMLRAGWFGRGIGLLDDEIMQQFEAWPG